MKKYNFYNPDTHKGYLPIRVLSHNVIDWFENSVPEFLDEMKFEVDTNGLKAGISYHIEESPIHTVSNIDSQKTIHLYENYNQFLWALSYSILVSFDEGIQRPHMEKRYYGKFDFDNSLVKTAFALFHSGLSLFKGFDSDQFFKLPNPEAYGEYDRFYIEKTNGVYIAAMVFTLIHEYSHHYYGHLEEHTKKGIKNDELDADNYAFHILSKVFDDEKGFSFKYGIIISLISLIFVDDTMLGDDEHPDPDDRLNIMLNKMNLDEKDSLWGIASMSILLWADYYKKEFTIPTSFINYKELFEYVKSHLDKIKNYS